MLADIHEEMILQEEDLYLVLHVLQPLQSQVGDDPWCAIINWQNIDLELLWSCCHYLDNQKIFLRGML